MARNPVVGQRMTLLERLRCDCGFSQRYVETTAGINHKTLTKYEDAISARISFEVLRRLAELYEVNASDLLADLRECVAEREAQELPDAA